MEWLDDAIVLSARRHGESSALVSILTRAHGRHAGLVRGGSGPRQRAVLATGNRVHARWRARLAEHLGTLTCEPEGAAGAAVLADGDRLAGVVAACALVDAALPEREPVPEASDALAALIAMIADDADWPQTYARWELALLGALGFGLDLSRCAGGGNDQLAYVSPRSGCALSLSAGEPYRERLLPLARFLIDETAPAGPAEIRDALRLTGHFFDHRVFTDARSGTPAARRRLVERLGRHVASED